MILYAISDLRDGPAEDVAAWAANCIRAGVDWVQIREKARTGAELWEMARQSRSRAVGGRVLINERADIAAAARLDGVHLPADSAGPTACRWALSREAVIGVSCHSLKETALAEEEGADFVVFGPVFDTPSKRGFGPPRGLSSLAEICRKRETPVLALGGVTAKNAAECRDAGAAGIAGISLFAGQRSLEETVGELRRL